MRYIHFSFAYLDGLSVDKKVFRWEMMNPGSNRTKMMLDENKDSIISMLDENKDGIISYNELRIPLKGVEVISQHSK